jgi:hypothetical protein
MRRRLSELFERGKEVRFNAAGVVDAEPLEEGEEHDPEKVYPTDDDVVVWVTPPSPLQRDMALREASATRARYILAAKRDESSPDAAQARASIVELDLDELVEFLLATDDQDRKAEAERNVLGEEEWEDFTELQDAMRQWAESDEDDDEKWSPLLARDLEFGRQVQAETDRLTDASRESLKLVGRDELEKRAIKSNIDMAGNAEFMNEYQRWMFHFACREGADHEQLAFEHPDDLGTLPDEITDALAEVYKSFIDTERSAKNSRRAVAGSATSAPSDAPETSESSTPEEQTA